MSATSRTPTTTSRACCASSASRRSTSLFAHIPERLRATRAARHRAARRGIAARAPRRDRRALHARDRRDVARRRGAVVPGRGRHAAHHPVGGRHAAAALRVVHELHAVPAGDLAGHAAGDLRVPDHRVRAVRPRRRQRVDVRRRVGGRRGGADGAARDRQARTRSSPARCTRTTSRPIDTYLAGCESGTPRRVAIVALRRRRARRAEGARRARCRPSDVACVVVQTPELLRRRRGSAGARRARRTRTARCWSSSTPSRSRSACSQSPGALGADIAVGEGHRPGDSADAAAGRASGCSRRKPSTCGSCPAASSARPSTRTGSRGYVLTLATREQHIRREKATSNICTNQGLIALAFTIHMCLLGTRGLIEMAQLNLAKAEYAKKQIAALRGFSLAFSGPTFNEFTVRLGSKRANQAAADWAARGSFCPACRRRRLGFTPRGSFDDLLVVAVTERHWTEYRCSPGGASIGSVSRRRGAPGRRRAPGSHRWAGQNVRGVVRAEPARDFPEAANASARGGRRLTEQRLEIAQLVDPVDIPGCSRAGNAPWTR